MAKLTAEKTKKLSIYFIETLILYKLQHIYMKYTTKGILPAILLLYIVKCIAIDAWRGTWRRVVSVRPSVCLSVTLVIGFISWISSQLNSWWNAFRYILFYFSEYLCVRLRSPYA